MTEARKQTFLKNLAGPARGVFAWACRLTDSDHPTGALQTWRDLLDNDPTFREQAEQAQLEADMKLLDALHKWGVEGVSTPLFQAGKRMMETVVDPATGKTRKVPVSTVRIEPRLLELAIKARRQIGDRFDLRNQQSIEVSGTVEHAPARMFLDNDSVALLNREERGWLRKILVKIAAARGEPVEQIDRQAQALEYVEHDVDETGRVGESR